MADIQSVTVKIRRGKKERRKKERKKKKKIPQACPILQGGYKYVYAMVLLC